MDKNNFRYGVMVLIAIFLPLGMSAQMRIKDDQQYLQWRSMETGPLEFAPASYYYCWHGDKGYIWNLGNPGDGYACYDYAWHWRGFHSRWTYDFDEERSKARPLALYRAEYLAEATEEADKIKKEAADLDSIAKNELLLESDRLLDAAIQIYGPSIRAYNNDVSKLSLKTAAILTAHPNEHLKSILDYVQEQQDLFYEQYHTIKETRLLENTKRQEVYHIINEEYKFLYQYAVIMYNRAKLHQKKQEMMG